MHFIYCLPFCPKFYMCQLIYHDIYMTWQLLSATMWKLPLSGSSVNEGVISDTAAVIWFFGHCNQFQPPEIQYDRIGFNLNTLRFFSSFILIHTASTYKNPSFISFPCHRKKNGAYPGLNSCSYICEVYFKSWLFSSPVVFHLYFRYLSVRGNKRIKCLNM